MAQDENFGYSLSLPELTNEEIARSLCKKIGVYKILAASSVLEAMVIPYVAENSSGKFPGEWEGVVYSGLILLEILVARAGLHSAYKLWQASKHLKGLEEKL